MFSLASVFTLIDTLLSLAIRVILCLFLMPGITSPKELHTKYVAGRNERFAQMRAHEQMMDVHLQACSQEVVNIVNAHLATHVSTDYGLIDCSLHVRDMTTLAQRANKHCTSEVVERALRNVVMPDMRTAGFVVDFKLDKLVVDSRSWL